MDFKQLNIIAPILKAFIDEGFEEPTPIQEEAIPLLLEGKDLLGSAQTGTGKTAAFAVPILQRLMQDDSIRPSFRVIRALILAPTRELAGQIRDNFKSYGKYLPLKTTCIFGGVNQSSQVTQLRAGVDILVATPGRLLDLMTQGHVDLKFVKTLVLDEADRMLDMGFVKDVEKIVKKLPSQRQTMLFSATMPVEIEKLAASILTSPVRLAVTPVDATIDKIAQSLYYVGKKQKSDLLLYLLQNPAIIQALVFTRTKHGANKLATYLGEFGVEVNAIHGNKSQNARERALADFKSRRLRVLVATDIAARGIDIAELSHVINFDLPEDPETYIHRMGRTGRAGFSGSVFSLCEPGEVGRLKDIQRHIHSTIPLIKDHPYAATFANASLDIPSVRQRVEAKDRVKISEDKEERRPSSGRPSSSRSSSGRPSYSHQDKPTTPRTSSHSEKPKEFVDPDFRKAKREYQEQQKQRAEKETAKKWEKKKTYEPKPEGFTKRPTQEFATTQQDTYTPKKPTRGYASKPSGQRFSKPTRPTDGKPSRSYGYPKKGTDDPKNTTVDRKMKADSKPFERKSYESYSKKRFTPKDKR